MKVETVSQPPPPQEIRMSFPVDEGWVIVAALSEYAKRHHGGVYAERWKAWASALDKELRG